MTFKVGSVSWREWVGFGAGLLAAGTLFLPWTTLSAASPEIESALRALPADDVVRDAWKSDFFAWCPPILLLLTGLAVALFGQVRKARVSGLPALWLVASAGNLLLMVAGWYAIGWQFGSEQRALFEAGGIAITPSYGRYLALACTIVSLAAAILDARAAREEYRAPKKKVPLKDS
ncbi:hypothetical protein [Amycolatopsis sp. NPDC059657]|uniref:hypothetical protein n=1 Tax=Amycolatopsis sp. NPDC059657 TaxID=3346899 RepID=UPI0036735EBF